MTEKTEANFKVMTDGELRELYSNDTAFIQFSFFLLIVGVIVVIVYFASPTLQEKGWFFFILIVGVMCGGCGLVCAVSGLWSRHKVTKELSSRQKISLKV